MIQEPTFKKVPADLVAYGTEIAQHRPYVWAACEDEQVICVAATSKEVRALYRRVKLGSAYGRAPAALPSELEGRPDRPRPLSDDRGRGGPKS